MLGFLLFIGAIFAVLAIWYFSWRKRLIYGNLTLITGGVKKGKTQLAVALAVKQYRKQLKKWRRKCRRARKRYEPLPEKPLLYSNMPIGREGDEYAPLTMELITLQERFRWGSVVYYNEASLIAGSKDIKDEELNDHLLKFFKLCAHFTMGGYVFLDTQSVSDCHYTIKRSLSTAFDIWQRVTLPFVSLIWLREMKIVDGDSVVAIDTQIDPQDSVADGGKRQYFRLISNKWWRYYDQYAYSAQVADLPVGDDVVQVKRDKKVYSLLRCRNIREALKGVKK